MTDAPREAARAAAYARRDLLNELMNPTEWVSGDVGLNEVAALKLVDAYDATRAAAVRTAAIREAAQVAGSKVRADHLGNGCGPCDMAGVIASDLHQLATIAARTTTTED